MKEIIFGRIFLNSILKGANSIFLRAKEHLLSEVHDRFVSLENVIKPTKLYCGWKGDKNIEKHWIKQIFSSLVFFTYTSNLEIVSPVEILFLNFYYF